MDDQVQRRQEKVAIKLLEKKKILGVKNGLPFLLNEIRAHWALERCEGVLKLLRIHEESEFIALVLEYQPKGSLMGCLENEKQFSEPEVRVIMEQTLLALDFFERKHIVHRDIKPDNILIYSIEDQS